jgi:predicted transposase YdaD
MNQLQIDKYQDAYRMAWDAQNKIDAKINKMVFASGQRPIQQYDTEIGRKYGKMGGRQKTQANVKLTDKAKVINNMLKHNLTAASIAGMLELTEKSVKDITERYGLPRDV